MGRAHPNNPFTIATLLSRCGLVEQCRASLPCCVGSGWRHPAASGNGGVGSRCGTWLQGVAPPTWHFGGGEVAQEGVSLEKLIFVSVITMAVMIIRCSETRALVPQRGF
ncbi:hypothetical protein E2C01_023503 [Portunus trituberculatus]|uniref:Uncharacterized protein n=1 Tax=Portunus trituberculatus TaxID=210409 RepID=A0A5B7EBA7_PORTR|nr:hypothetical protein [Portunus trituberculatus]